MSQCLCLLCKKRETKNTFIKNFNPCKYPSENIDTQTTYLYSKRRGTFSKPSFFGICIVKLRGCTSLHHFETPKALGSDCAGVVLVTIRRHQRQHQVRWRGFLTGSGWKRVDVKRTTSLHQVIHVHLTTQCHHHH